MKIGSLSRIVLCGLAILTCCGCGGDGSSDDGKKITLLNVSYDPTRELYKDYNAAQKLDGELEQDCGGVGIAERCVLCHRGYCLCSGDGL